MGIKARESWCQGEAWRRTIDGNRCRQTLSITSPRTRPVCSYDFLIFAQAIATYTSYRVDCGVDGAAFGHYWWGIRDPVHVNSRSAARGDRGAAPIRCSYDVLAGRNESAKTTTYPMWNAVQYSFRERRDDGTQTKDVVRWLRGTHVIRAPAEEGDVWGDARGEGLHRGTGVGLDEGPWGGH